MRIRNGLIVLATLAITAQSAVAADRIFSSVNIEYEGTKVWVPSTFIVQKGDKVRITLINKVPSDPPEHGFAIPNFGIAEVVKRGEPKTVEFVADKTGIFPIQCHLHPAHLGGQLVVVE